MKLGWAASVLLAIGASALCAAAAAQAGQSRADGVAQGEALKAMFADGVLTPDEKAEAVRMLPRYYGLWVSIASTKGNNGVAGHLYLSKIECLEALERKFRDDPDQQMAYAEFFPLPTPATVTTSRALVKRGFDRLLAELLAARGHFPDLAGFDAAHLTITATGIWFDSEKTALTKRPDRPIISIQAMPLDEFTKLGEKAPPPHALYGRQKIALTIANSSGDPNLAAFVSSMVIKAFADLGDFEKSLGSAPKPDWSQVIFVGAPPSGPGR